MSVWINGKNKASRLFIGGKDVSKAYYNGKLIFQKKKNPFVKLYLKDGTIYDINTLDELNIINTINKNSTITLNGVQIEKKSFDKFEMFERDDWPSDQKNFLRGLQIYDVNFGYRSVISPKSSNLIIPSKIKEFVMNFSYDPIYDNRGTINFNNCTSIGANTTSMNTTIVSHEPIYKIDFGFKTAIINLNSNINLIRSLETESRSVNGINAETIIIRGSGGNINSNSGYPALIANTIKESNVIDGNNYSIGSVQQSVEITAANILLPHFDLYAHGDCSLLRGFINTQGYINSQDINFVLDCKSFRGYSPESGGNRKTYTNARSYNLTIRDNLNVQNDFFLSTLQFDHAKTGPENVASENYIGRHEYDTPYEAIAGYNHLIGLMGFSEKNPVKMIAQPSFILHSNNININNIPDIYRPRIPTVDVSGLQASGDLYTTTIGIAGYNNFIRKFEIKPLS